MSSLTRLRSLARSSLVRAEHLCTTAGTDPSAQRRTGSNLFEVVGRLPNYGVGSRVYRASWAEKGYSPETHHWVVKRTLMRSKVVENMGELERGKAWGELLWKGQPTGQIKRITSGCKREWLPLPHS